MTPNVLRITKVVVFLLCLVPLAWYAWGLAHPEGRLLGADPVEASIRGVGLWALKFLLLSLAITPMRRITGWNTLIKFRRMLGLYGFFYALVHLSLYLVFEQTFDLAGLWRDVMKRPFITVGMVAFVLLVPLAITSTQGMVRRLGKHWRQLHRVVYVIAPLGALHYLWMVKADIRPPLIYGGIAALLLAMRLWWWHNQKMRQS